MKNIGDDVCNVGRIGDRLGQVTKMFVTGRSLIGIGLKDIVAVCRASEMFAAGSSGNLNENGGNDPPSFQNDDNDSQ